MRGFAAATVLVSLALCCGSAAPDGPDEPDPQADERRRVAAAAAAARRDPQGRLPVLRRNEAEVVFGLDRRLEFLAFNGPTPDSLLWISAVGIRLVSLSQGTWRHLVLDDDAFPRNADRGWLPYGPSFPPMGHHYQRYWPPQPVSPAGRYVAYHAVDGPAVLDLKTGAVVIHAGDRPPLPQSCQWRSDEQLWLYTQDHGWFTKPALDAAARWQPAELERTGIWSPDGARLLSWYWEGPGTTAILQVLDEAGTVLREREGIEAVELAWSPDGRYISGLLVPFRELAPPEVVPPEPTRGFIWDSETGELMSPLSQPRVPPERVPWTSGYGAGDRAVPPRARDRVRVVSERCISWNSRSTQVAFLARTAEGEEITPWDLREGLRRKSTDYRLMIYDVTSHEVREFAAAASRMMCPLWRNDDQAIVFHSLISPTGTEEYPSDELTWRKVPESLRSD
jgi:hypothetical protein